MHSELVVNLVSAFVAAFIGGFIASRIGLPTILGYLLAGIAIGPHTPVGGADPAIASELAEVGIILLMFGVGLHFSISELTAVGRIAVPGAIGQSTFATLLGVGLSQLLGWSLSEGLILGLSLSVASTVVLLRALEDRNLLETHSGHVAVGWLIVEDLFTVLILVVLPVLADSGATGKGAAALVDGTSPVLEITVALAQALFFVAIMLLLGVKLIPRLLTEVVRSGSRELFTLCILALALGVAFGSAEIFGASLALGAFLAGVVLNESELSYRAGLEALPLRDAFAVLFFVSVGMLFDPAILVDEPLQVLLVVLIVVVGKSAAAFLFVTGLGYGTRTGLTVSAALAQVGEFSFILAAMGTSLAILPEEATSLILAAAIISITLNPFLFRSIDVIERLFQRWSRFEAFAERREPRNDVTLAMRRHAIICGYGRSGSNLARTLGGRGLPFVVIDNDPFVFARAQAAGLTCVFGDASSPVVLERAQVAEARTLAVTFPTQPTAPLTIQNAKRLNPNLDVVARGFGPDSHGLLRTAGAAEVVDPEFEASIEFVRHVLHRYGVDAREIVALQQRRRGEYYSPAE